MRQAYGDYTLQHSNYQEPASLLPFWFETNSLRRVQHLQRLEMLSLKCGGWGDRNISSEQQHQQWWPVLAWRSGCPLRIFSSTTPLACPICLCRLTDISMAAAFSSVTTPGYSMRFLNWGPLETPYQQLANCITHSGGSQWYPLTSFSPRLPTSEDSWVSWPELKNTNELPT